jgi:hypothetical protein
VSAAGSLGLIEAEAATGAIQVWQSADPGFASHLAACLSEGLCPYGHTLEIPPAGMAFGRICRRCEPAAYWMAALPGGWMWTRWPDGR